MREHLRLFGYVWKRPRHELHEAKSPRVLRRLRAIRKQVRSLPPGCVKLFEDETDLPDDGDPCTNDYCNGKVAMFDPVCGPTEFCMGGLCY